MSDQERIKYFKSEITRLSNQVVSLLDERDELKAQVEQLCEVGDDKTLHESLSKVEFILWQTRQQRK